MGRRDCHVGSLQFLVSQFQLLDRGLQLLVGVVQALVDQLQLLVRDLQLFDQHFLVGFSIRHLLAQILFLTASSVVRCRRELG